VGGERFYEVEGTLYPSVSAVLSTVAKPGLAAWARRTALEKVRELLAQGVDVATALALAEREPERVRDVAARRGAAVHEDIALALAGHPSPPETAPWVEAARRFLDDFGLRPVASELVVVSKRHGFAGTCDTLAQCAGALYVLDWKTTGALWPEAALQVAGYAIALEELTGREVQGALVVRLDETGRYEVRGVHLPLAQEGFLAALSLWRALRGELYGRPPMGEPLQEGAHG
jgi:ATP-dependent exoDNAse (exonuclease V) beta subunit